MDKPISIIKINKRIRQNVGDITQLADSIAAIGLLQPIVIDSKDNLIAGYRRLLACQSLGWLEIPIIVTTDIDTTLKALKAERDENTCRLDFTPSEAVEMAKVIEPLEKEAALQRKATNNNERENFTPSEKGKALDKTAQAVGMSRPTYVKAKNVVEFARDFPQYDYIIKEMDKTGKVDRAHKEVRRVKKLEARQQVEVSINSNVWHGDFREVGRKISDNSVDIIFTDPPYNEDAILDYKDLGEFANRVLKPGGLCLAYSGQIHLPQVLNALSENLEYIWCFATRHSSGYTRIFKINGRNMWKPILFFAKEPYQTWWKTIDDMIDGQMEKDSHEWQQAFSEAEYYLSQLCPQNGLVVDPFCGSGTTLVAAKSLGFNYIGIDNNPESVNKTIERISNGTT